MQNYKKSRIWIPIVLIIVILAVGIGVFLNERNKEFKGNGSAEELWNARTQYIGDNSAVGKILSMLPLAQGLEHDHFKLWTDGDERGLEWVLNDKEGLQLTLADKEQMNRNALLLFSLIDNLEEFSIGIQDDIEVFTRQDYDRDWADQVVMGDVRDYAKSPEKLQELMDYSLENLNNIDVEKHQEILLSDYEYDGEDLVEGLVYNTEIEAHSYSKERGGFVIVAPKIFASYEEEDMLKVFVTTYCMRYKLFGRTLSEVSGSVISAAITYRKDNNNEYTLESYQGARDGSEFETSIREYCTQPVSGKKIVGLADEIFNHYSDYDDIRKLHYENLNKHLKKNGITDAGLSFLN